MRASPLWALILAALVSLIEASRPSIGFELVSCYYAYKMEYSVVKKPEVNTPLDMARGCRGTGPNGMCTFNEFVSHISRPRGRNGPVRFNPGSEGGRNTVDPDVDVVGRDFQKYVSPNWGYSYELIDDKRLHVLSHTWINANPRSQMSLSLRMGNVYKTIDYITNTVTPESARAPTDASNTDRARCLAAADKATAARNTDLGKDLYKFMVEAGDFVDSKGNKRTINVDHIEKSYEADPTKKIRIISLSGTQTKSGFTTPQDLTEFKNFVKDVRQGNSQSHHSTVADDFARKMPGHVDAAKAMKGFATDVRKC